MPNQPADQDLATHMYVALEGTSGGLNLPAEIFSISSRSYNLKTYRHSVGMLQGNVAGGLPSLYLTLMVRYS